MGKRKYNDDDGRQIVDMSGLESVRFARKTDTAEPRDNALSELTTKETRSVVFGALTAGLLVGGIFIAGAAVVIGLCLLIWS